MLRTNNGEFTSHDFDDFCQDEGIKRELTLSYNHRQNGVAERNNKSICEASKAMIHDQDLPMCSIPNHMKKEFKFSKK